jgi:hypothetical protein
MKSVYVRASMAAASGSTTTKISSKATTTLH